MNTAKAYTAWRGFYPTITVSVGTSHDRIPFKRISKDAFIGLHTIKT
jgi:hypothetical protein